MQNLYLQNMFKAHSTERVELAVYNKLRESKNTDPTNEGDWMGLISWHSQVNFVNFVSWSEGDFRKIIAIYLSDVVKPFVFSFGYFCCELKNERLFRAYISHYIQNKQLKFKIYYWAIWDRRNCYWNESFSAGIGDGNVRNMCSQIKT